ncbi:unnamed protein product [Brachionus calyciflorus]|uniref:Nicotinamide riboside kinase 1 n=1 Tax=Brachionus calyciflorus TaxID=104777 RepID=A0A814EM80_9BILA|nr:unnamed protein product [Brachionus calyciflorus]
MYNTKLIGISGCTNGGKTTLSKSLQKEFISSTFLTQDDYYFPRDSDHLEFISELNSFNFDVISAIDVDKFFYELIDIKNSGKYELIFLDGFLLFEDERVYKMLDKKYFLFLNKQECWLRRISRNYKTADTPNYFDKCVWPEYLKYKEKCDKKYDDIIYIDGSRSISDIFNFVSNEIKSLI